MNDIAPERVILAAQAACPFPLDPTAALPEDLPRLQSEFALSDQAQFGSPGILLTNLRFCGRLSVGWGCYLLRDVAEVAWREDQLAPKRSFGIFSRLIDGPPKRVERTAGSVELKLRNGASVRFSSTQARPAAEAVASLAKSARALTG